ncbi:MULTISPECIES: hypothetical protein [unclassified Streptomyces]|uniref:hypothetical protein n=1 Tax=Streptomyces sp. NPDC056835 TaxID=3345956 RepID=UPI0036BD3E1D
MMNVNRAWAIYTGTRAEMGADGEAMELTQSEGTYYLHRGENWPLTLGTETETIDALLASAFSLRNIG